MRPFSTSHACVHPTPSEANACVHPSVLPLALASLSVGKCKRAGPTGHPWIPDPIHRGRHRQRNDLIPVTFLILRPSLAHHLTPQEIVLPREVAIQLDETQPSFEALTHSKAWKYGLNRANTNTSLHSHTPQSNADTAFQSQTRAEMNLNPPMILDSSTYVFASSTHPPLVPGNAGPWAR